VSQWRGPSMGKATAALVVAKRRAAARIPALSCTTPERGHRRMAISKHDPTGQRYARNETGAKWSRADRRAPEGRGLRREAPRPLRGQQPRAIGGFEQVGARPGTAKRSATERREDRRPREHREIERIGGRRGKTRERGIRARAGDHHDRPTTLPHPRKSVRRGARARSAGTGADESTRVTSATWMLPGHHARSYFRKVAFRAR